MRVLVCGGRNFRSWGTVWHELSRLHDALSPITAIIHGGATGADTFAGQWAEVKAITCHVYRAKWAEYGKAAGPIRNSIMLNEGNPDLVLAFPGGRGTADMVAKAEAAGIKVVQINQAAGETE